MRSLLLVLILTASVAVQAGPPAPRAPASAGSGIPARVQLQDVDIQGEANGDGLRLSQRDANDIREKLKLRSNFLDRVQEEVPKGWRGPAAEKPSLGASLPGSR